MIYLGFIWSIVFGSHTGCTSVAIRFDNVTEEITVIDYKKKEFKVKKDAIYIFDSCRDCMIYEDGLIIEIKE